MNNILNLKFYSEVYFFLSDLYFVLIIFLLLLVGLFFTKELFSLYNNVLLIDLSLFNIIFLLCFNYYLYDINIDLFLGQCKLWSFPFVPFIYMAVSLLIGKWE